MPSPRSRQAGQATAEYTVVLLAAVIVLLARPDVITELVDALKAIYRAFTFSISMSSIPLL
ncbi:MAG: hypothetical protein Q4F49_01890 [Pseudoxanthomonas suwonensis]|nr:hypothetical protein [Pseudoxanthomonas suwonensis]